MNNKFWIIIWLIVLFFSVGSVQANTDIEYILDVSGSMRKMSEGRSQIDIARESLMKSLQNIPASTHVALRVYGHRVEQTDKARSCEDTELVISFGEVNQVGFQSRIKMLEPKGYTPIAYSLLQSKNDFNTQREAKKVIILLSDGEETCDGDPIAVLKELKSQGFEVMVHTIGFNVDAKTREQLKAISDYTGGQYFDANGATELNKALEEATKQSFVIEKTKSVYGEEVRGGDSYETAVALPFKKELRLDHHQIRKQYDYFYVDLKAGQQVTVELHTLENGISIRNGNEKLNDNPYAGLQIHNSNRKNLKTLTIIGTKHGVKEFNFNVPISGRYYLLIGNDYADQHKDHVTFKVNTSLKGDMGGNEDAGDTIKTALLIEPGRHEVNHLGGADLADTFAFVAKKDERYMVAYIPNDNIDDKIKIKVWDEFKQEVFKAESAQNNTGLKSEPFKINADGRYFVHVALYSGWVKTPLSYTLILQKVE